MPTEQKYKDIYGGAYNSPEYAGMIAEGGDLPGSTVTKELATLVNQGKLKITEVWSRLTDDERDSFKGDLARLNGEQRKLENWSEGEKLALKGTAMGLMGIALGPVAGASELLAPVASAAKSVAGGGMLGYGTYKGAKYLGLPEPLAEGLGALAGYRGMGGRIPGMKSAAKTEAPPPPRGLAAGETGTMFEPGMDMPATPPSPRGFSMSVPATPKTPPQTTSSGFTSPKNPTASPSVNSKGFGVSTPKPVAPKATSTGTSFTPGKMPTPRSSNSNGNGSGRSFGLNENEEASIRVLEENAAGRGESAGSPTKGNGTYKEPTSKPRDFSSKSKSARGGSMSPTDRELYNKARAAGSSDAEAMDIVARESKMRAPYRYMAKVAEKVGKTK